MLFPARKLLIPLSMLLGAAATTAVLDGCGTGSSTTTINPVTGVIIRANTLVAGFGCGTKPTQVYKYYANAVPVGLANAGGPYDGVYDCFADGDLVNLPGSTSGNQQFSITIHAFNEPDFDRQQAAANGASPSTFAPTWSTTCCATQQPNIQVLAVCGRLVGPGAGANTGVTCGSDATGGADAGTDASDAAADASDAATD